jgi:L-ascorbate metabolism protein UlaG (beta-lactamase superfamily)
MKITKLGHSCVLIETEDRVGLFDAGGWSDRKLIDAIKHVDRIIYTHEHGDHFDIDILKGLVNKFPNVHVVCNQQIKKLIIDAGIDTTIREETNCTRIFLSPHERLPFPDAVAPSQNGYHFKDIFTHPGDSQSFSETKKVLTMPFIGPWGKTGDSIAKVLELKPEYVLPIHDWHYTEEAKQWLQNMLEEVFSKYGIKLLPNKIGEAIEII